MAKKITENPGKYTGSGQGKESQINLEVEVDSDKIVNVKPLDKYTPDSLADNAFKKMAQKIVDQQSVDVDVVSGASETSHGIIEGVKEALNKAGVDFDA
ncbi:MAG: FMN-binding protein, partial [Lactobacillus sp.]|nr:FMN-binding protein [Lactobacillus sp.]